MRVCHGTPVTRRLASTHCSNANLAVRFAIGKSDNSFLAALFAGITAMTLGGTLATEGFAAKTLDRGMIPLTPHCKSRYARDIW